jgi:hypothetical protein
MAKLTAPLFSFGASGKLANALVFLKWKGLDDVRQYVVPTNPQTPAQTTQRITNFKAGVTKWHTFSLSALDLAAWTLKASTCISKVHPSYIGQMTHFNAFMRQFVDTMVANAAAIWHEVSHITVTAIGAGTFTINCDKGTFADGLQAYYGTTKTYMPNLIGMTGGGADDNMHWTPTGLLPSTKYYFHIYAGAANQMGQTGIYSAITTAA